MDDSNSSVVAHSNALLLPNRTGNRPVEVPADLPGVVIFLHGVNDPGASYETVEKGLCQGLNERLDRNDLRSGRYGAAYSQAQRSTAKPGDRQWPQVAAVKYDPDTYLYRRTEDLSSATPTHSVLIPFYWGYRAKDDEIARDRTGNPSRHRSQYQDTAGNRLDANFAKAGGFFANATSNLPDMYAEGFETGVRTFLTQPMVNEFTYFGRGPSRRYFVLAAERLAMLVSEIRRIDPNETINIIGHSQGTLITLLSQALLAERGERCADCCIMVDTPYSVLEPGGEEQTSKAKIDTLVNIVKAVTENPHSAPALSELEAGRPGQGGRAGTRWRSVQGTRLDKQGNNVVFAERDNRGKVYLYFCPQDTTVALDDVKGIGTYGVPDKVTAQWIVDKGGFLSTNIKGYTETYDAMDKLKTIGFRQRMWTKVIRNGQPVLVGLQPQNIALRIDGELRYPGGGISATTVASQTALPMENRYINGEPLQPPHAPDLEGGTAVRGTPTRPSKDAPDDVSINVALGNPRARLNSYPLPVERISRTELSDAELRRMRDEYNSSRPDINDHTPGYQCAGDREMGFAVQRQLSPNELRALMAKDRNLWSDNSYHSAVLRSTENHRWVTAMDVAIGQARALDDPEWRVLLIAIANWRIPFEPVVDDSDSAEFIRRMAKYSQLSGSAQLLVRASCRYYAEGKFPEKLISSLPSRHVVSQTRKEREETSQ